VRLWRVSDGTQLWSAPGHAGGSTSVAISADGQTVFSGGRDDKVRWWRASDGLPLLVLSGHTNTITCLALSPDGQTLASAGFDQTIRLWRTSDGSAIRTITGSPSAIQSIAFSPSGLAIAAAEDAFGQNVQLFEVATGTLVRTFAGDANGFSESVAFSPGGTLISTSGFTHEIRFWRVSDGTQLALFDKETGWGPDPLLPIAASRDGMHVVFGRGDATVVAATNPLP